MEAINGGYWAYAGWQAVPAYVEDIKNPRRNVPLAIILGLVITTVVYLLINFAFLCVLSIEEIKTSQLLVTSFADKLGGNKSICPTVSNSHFRRKPLCTSVLVGIALSLWSQHRTFSSQRRFCFAASREGHIPG